jgi:hypothetical protein
MKNINIMNIKRLKHWMAVSAAALTATAVCGEAPDLPADAGKPAGQPATAARPEKSYTGTIVSVDPKEHVLSVKNWALSRKTFNLGDNCTCVLLFSTLANNQGTANDLRPGEKVTVGYQDTLGVLIADRIKQRPDWHGTGGRSPQRDHDEHVTGLSWLPPCPLAAH